jgi:hypothetical protein
MTLFFDTSALIKRYVNEDGSAKVDELFESASHILVSSVTKIEAFSALRRLEAEKHITRSEFKTLGNELENDFSFFSVMPLSPEVEASAVQHIIQFASCLAVKDVIDFFVAADARLVKAALRQKLKVIDPTQE